MSYSRNRGQQATRKERAAIAKETLQILHQGSYTTADGEGPVQIANVLQHCVENTKHYDTETLSSLQRTTPTSPTGKTKNITVTGEKVLAAAERLVVQEKANDNGKVTILNFASARNPGGGFLNGSMAQEESLALAGGLYASQIPFMKTFYKNQPAGFYRHDMLYSPDVPIFRHADTCELIPYYTVDILTAPAVNAGAVKQNQPERMDEIPGVMQERVDYMFRLAASQGTKTLILGAWGCGVFGNNPENIARWFKEAISKHDGYGIEHIVFACYGVERNRTPFDKLFSSEVS